jgi:non-ribosomal peptide synthetase component F
VRQYGGDTDRDRLLNDFNATHVDYPSEKLVHQLFEEQVEKRGDLVAVMYENERISYAELNRRANQLAHYLLSLGVRPDDRVAICVERSIEMVVGLLGILKSGAAYVPLDPSYPTRRLAHMLKDSAPVALLTQAALQRHEALQSATLPMVVLDTPQQSGPAQQPQHNPDLGGTVRKFVLSPVD